MGVRDPRSRGPAAALNAVRHAADLVRYTVRGAVADRALDRAAALAYVTLLSLVPGLAAMAALARSVFSAHAEGVVAVALAVLPYTTETVERTLAEFTARATALGGISFLVFAAIAFRLFLAIEETLNEIWGVARRRPFHRRLFSFTVVLFWGPVLLGLGTTALLWLERQPWAPSAGAVVAAGRIALPLVGFTMVYWLAPNTGVHLASAAAGGILATAGLTAIRWGIVAYLRAFPDINVIFGSLALAVIFLTSLFLLWAVVIVGAEVSYVAQNLDALRRGAGEPDGPHPDPEQTAVAMILLCFRLLRDGEAATVDRLAGRLGITHRYARELADRLVAARLLALTGEDRAHLVPTADAGRLTLAEVVVRLGEERTRDPGGEPVEAIAPLREVFARAEQARLDRLAGVRLAELAANPGEPT